MKLNERLALWIGKVFLLLPLILGGVVYILFKNLEAKAVAAAVIGAGIPALYYLYREWVQRPIITIEKQMQHRVAPVIIREIESVHREGTIGEVKTVIFSKVKLENHGKATAKDCMIKVDMNERQFNARWSRPENPDRYNLLPHEPQSFCIFRAIMTPNYPKYIDLSTGELVKGRKGELIKEEASWRPRKIWREYGIEPRSEHPKGKPPETKEKSTWGGWVGTEVKPAKYKISVEAIAENYTSKIVSLTPIKLPEKLLHLAVDNDLEWQDQWQSLMNEDTYKEYKDDFQVACRNYLKRSK